MVEMAQQVTLSEGDWFDGITVNRHMKGLNESYKVFEKTAQEISRLQERLSASYEDIGQGLSKYFGEHPKWFYLVAYGPAMFTAAYPFVLYSL